MDDEEVPIPVSTPLSRRGILPLEDSNLEFLFDREVRRLFEVADTDNNGTISKGE